MTNCKQLWCITIIFIFLLLTAFHVNAQENLRGDESHLPYRTGKVEYWKSVKGIMDDPDVTLTGEWNEIIFRRSFPRRRNLNTTEDNATLERTFSSSGLVLVLETHRPYVYPAGLNDGILEVSVDGEVKHVIHPLNEANEIVLFRDLEPEERQIRLRHKHAPNGGRGVSVIGFREVNEPSADLSFFLTGEAGDLLVDARITVLDGDQVLRTVVQRNWMSGKVRLAGLPPGENYFLRVEALGWQSIEIPLPPLHAGSERILTPVHLKLDNELLAKGFENPAPGYPAVKRPGDTLKISLNPGQGELPVKVLAVRWVQTTGEARRQVKLWDGEKPVSEEGLNLNIVLPDRNLHGMGDLVADVQGPDGVFTWRAPRSLQFRENYPDQPVFITLGHLDTWGHYQGEYLENFAEMANIINPDAVLISNEVHPAYTIGGLRSLQVPHLVTIGNHSFGYEQNPSFLDADGNPRPGPPFQISASVGEVHQDFIHREPHYDWRHFANRAFDRWYGNPVGIMSIAPDIAVLNYGWSWEPEYNREVIENVRKKFEPYRNSRIRVLNAYESEPTREFLDHFDFALVHSAHAWPRARAMHADDPQAVRGHHFAINNGATTFIGKQTSDTFRIIRFADDRVVSHSYAGHEYQPWPLDRHRVAPLRMEFLTDDALESSDDRIHEARLVNDFSESFQDCSIDWVLPAGRYEINGGSVVQSWDSDDGKWTVFTISADVSGNSFRDLQAVPVSH